MKTKLLFVLVLISIALSGYSILKHEHALKEPKVTGLFQSELDPQFTQDREVKVDLVEFPPNSKFDKHRHPGEEFHYYLEGEVEIKLEGDSSIIGKPGTVGHVPFQKLHEAITGPEGAKVLVFRVHTKGKPWRYTDENDRD